MITDRLALESHRPTPSAWPISCLRHSTVFAAADCSASQLPCTVMAVVTAITTHQWATSTSPGLSPPAALHADLPGRDHPVSGPVQPGRGSCLTLGKLAVPPPVSLVETPMDRSHPPGAAPDSNPQIFSTVTVLLPGSSLEQPIHWPRGTAALATCWTILKPVTTPIF